MCRNIPAEQVALATQAADELDKIGNQILDPPHWRKQYFEWAVAVRFVIENYGLVEAALEQAETELADKELSEPEDHELPPNIKSLVEQCEANVTSFSNDQMSQALHWGQVLAGRRYGRKK